MLYGHDVTEKWMLCGGWRGHRRRTGVGTYLHGLFDSDAFTRAVVNGLRARKGLAPWETTFCYAEHKARQFDLLAEAMRQHIDIDKIYTIMQQHQEPI